jgi:hypothetical protein
MTIFNNGRFVFGSCCLGREIATIDRSTPERAIFPSAFGRMLSGVHVVSFELVWSLRARVVKPNWAGRIGAFSAYGKSGATRGRLQLPGVQDTHAARYQHSLLIFVLPLCVHGTLWFTCFQVSCRRQAVQLILCYILSYRFTTQKPSGSKLARLFFVVVVSFVRT